MTKNTNPTETALKAKKNNHAQDLICKTFSPEERKVKIENKLLPLFRRSMSAKHEKSTNYIQKAIDGQNPTMRIANRVRIDFALYQKHLHSIIEILDN